MKDVEQQQAKSSAKVDRSKLSVVLIFGTPSTRLSTLDFDRFSYMMIQLMHSRC